MEITIVSFSLPLVNCAVLSSRQENIVIGSANGVNLRGVFFKIKNAFSAFPIDYFNISVFSTTSQKVFINIDQLRNPVFVYLVVINRFNFVVFECPNKHCIQRT